MTISQTLTTPTTAPARTQDKDTFNTNVDARLAWQATNVTEITTWQAQANALAATLNSVMAGGLSLSYAFSTTITDSDPGAGVLRLNNATQNASSVIRVSNTSGGVDVSDLLNTFDDSTSSAKAVLVVQKVSDISKWIVFSLSSIASPAGYKNFTVSVMASSAATPFADADDLLLKFTRTGDKGDTGPTGGITLGTPVAITSGTAIDFTGIAAGTKRISINLSGVSHNANDNILFQLGDSGGIENTGYISTACGLASGGSISAASSTAGVVLRYIDGAWVTHGIITFTLMNSSTNLWAAAGVVSYSATENGFTSGSKSLSGELTQLRITTVSGASTFDAGSINITTE